MSDPLLSTLCSICHVKPLKYRCPRCSTLTCSLPCIKRHKQWAQCNGIRDPSKYIKHKDLATPKGIDHDYNYLTSIEREIDCAERNAASRGVILEERVRPKGEPYDKGEFNLKKAIERCGVIVVKAPKGMSRSKQNATQWTKKNKTLRWSVEWVHPDGTKTMSMCPENQPIPEAYAAHLDSLDPWRDTKRRKLDHNQSEVSNLNNETQPRPEEPPSDIPKPLAQPTEPLVSDVTTDDTLIADIRDECISPRTDNFPDSSSRKRLKRRKALDDQSHKPQVERITQQQLEEWTHDLSKGRTLEDTRTEELRGSARKTAEAIQGMNPNPTTSETSPSPPLTYHLHHPSLPSPRPVLIPLPPTANLLTTLPSRLVLEFPTIYVLHSQPSNKLPENFISEEEFFDKAGKEMVMEVEEGEIGDDGELGMGGGVEREEGEVDERRLIEVLGRDLGGGEGGL